MSTLGNLRILTADVHIPSTGAWWAEVSLDSSTLPALGPATLSLSDLTLTGQVVRTDFDDNPRGGKPYAVVRGGAGWRKPVAFAGGYQGGTVLLSTVLTDLASLTGESIVQPATASSTSLGASYAWQAHTPAAPVHYEDVLADLMSRGAIPSWRIDPATGATRFDPWPTLPAADGRGRVMSRRLARNHRHVGLDTVVSAFLPGATLEGAAISRVRITQDSGKLTADVYLDSTITAHQSIRRVLVQLFPWLTDLVLAAGTKGQGLAIRAAGGLLHLAGGPTDPGVARVGDGTGYLYAQIGTGNVIALFYSPTQAPNAAWTPVASGVAPTPTTPGTAISIQTGSGKVTCA